MQTDERTTNRLLLSWGRGDRAAIEELAPHVQRELYALAGKHLRRDRRNHTLQPTALINEVYSRLMRNIPVDYARERQAVKRGGGEAVVTFEDAATVSAGGGTLDILELDEALNRLPKVGQRLAEVIEMRFFAGMTCEEIAEAAGVSVATVHRDMRLAKAWLRSHLGDH